MHVRNIHSRKLRASPREAGALLDTLASPDDRLWPLEAWPRMALDGPLGVGAHGGHGPIRYVVAAYDPHRSLRFRFTGPVGFDGWHGFDVVEGAHGGCALRHVLDMRLSGRGRLTWPLLYRPLHDALIEDALTRAESSLGEAENPVPWSAYVRFLRWALTGGRARTQHR